MCHQPPPPKTETKSKQKKQTTNLRKSRDVIITDGRWKEEEEKKKQRQLPADNGKIPIGNWSQQQQTEAAAKVSVMRRIKAEEETEAESAPPNNKGAVWQNERWPNQNLTNQPKSQNENRKKGQKKNRKQIKPLCQARIVIIPEQRKRNKTGEKAEVVIRKADCLDVPKKKREEIKLKTRCAHKQSFYNPFL